MKCVAMIQLMFTLSGLRGLGIKSKSNHDMCVNSDRAYMQNVYSMDRKGDKEMAQQFRFHVFRPIRSSSDYRNSMDTRIIPKVETCE